MPSSLSRWASSARWSCFGGCQHDRPFPGQMRPHRARRAADVAQFKGLTMLMLDALRQQIDRATPDELTALSLAHLGVDDADADDLRDFIRELAYARGEPCGY